MNVVGNKVLLLIFPLVCPFAPSIFSQMTCTFITCITWTQNMHSHDKMKINRTNEQTGGKHRSNTFILIAFISFGLFDIFCSCNYYYRFVKEFNISTNLLTQLTRIAEDYIWMCVMETCSWWGDLIMESVVIMYFLWMNCRIWAIWCRVGCHGQFVHTTTANLDLHHTIAAAWH